ncbi:hypothetical protein ACQP00_00120 [Dactylosporangium sp. CS-047395]|uniref:hypothetical protein n=1 Tax=Dactylosporangium sp. CS-047395 TaxID=3239936 RepID=UPI003D8AD002
MYGILVGLGFLLVGLALAVNFKGIATKHVALSSRLVGPVSPHRKAEKVAQRQVGMVRMERMLGGVFAAFGLYAVGWAVWDLLFG